MNEINKNKSIFLREKEVFLPTFSRIPIEISHGKGAFLVDKKGDEYLDFFSGLAVNALGYAHPKIVEAVTKQISKFAHLSNSYITDVQVEFGELLLKHSGMSRLFLSNSGTESIEGAIKIIRKKYGPDKKLFAMTDSFHGRTYGALTLTGRDKYKKGFEPMLPNIGHIKFNDVEDLRKNVDGNTAAVFLEFIQGEGGINEVTPDFVAELTALRGKYGFAIVADSIQCGIGRTGKPFSHSHFNVLPDIIAVAKSIGGGLPLGAFLVSEDYINTFETGKHGTTFGGNPVSCAAGKVVLEEVFENGLMEQVFTNGEMLKQELTVLKNAYPNKIKEVRGRGFMIGIELFDEGSKVVEMMRSMKILVNCTNLKVIRLLPPLIVGEAEIKMFLNAFEETMKAV
jgi:predicted acetylornithine/succinylornithine family transaminase